MSCPIVFLLSPCLCPLAKPIEAGSILSFTKSISWTSFKKVHSYSFTTAIEFHNVLTLAVIPGLFLINRALTQKDGWKTQNGRMSKKCSARLCIPNLTRHFFVILPSWVFQSSCCVSSLLLERGKGNQPHRPIKLIAKRFRALWYFFQRVWQDL